MPKNTLLKKIKNTFCTLSVMLLAFSFAEIKTDAVSHPSITVSFDTHDESVIVEGIPAYNADGSVEYQLEGYLNYEKERVETFYFAPKVKPYDVPEKMAYIFNWSGDAEFLLPCTGDYKFTAYVTARYVDSQGQGHEEKGPKTTITITLHKKDESTNWGPGLPNTTVESYDLKQIKGKNKKIKIEEADYTWIIHGKDIESVPDQNLSLKITANPDTFPMEGVDDFFGNTLFQKFNIEHNGEFGFQAILDYRIGTEYTGKYANLFYVVSNGSFEYMGGTIVNESGIASFPFTHASDYILAITDVEYSGQELNPKIEEPIDETTPTEGTTTEEDNVPTDDTASSESSSSTAAPIETEPVTQPESTEAPTAEVSAPQPHTDSTSSDVPGTSSTTTLPNGNLSIWLVFGAIVLIAVIIVVIYIVKKKL